MLRLHAVLTVVLVVLTVAAGSLAGPGGGKSGQSRSNENCLRTVARQDTGTGGGRWDQSVLSPANCDQVREHPDKPFAR